MKKRYIKFAIIAVMLLVTSGCKHAGKEATRLEAVDQKIMELLGEDETVTELNRLAETNGYHYDYRIRKDYDDWTESFSVTVTDDFSDVDLNEDYSALEKYIFDNYQNIESVAIYKEGDVFESADPHKQDDRVISYAEIRTRTEDDCIDYQIVNIKVPVGTDNGCVLWDNQTYIYAVDESSILFQSPCERSRIHSFQYDSGYPIFYFHDDGECQIKARRTYGIVSELEQDFEYEVHRPIDGKDMEIRIKSTGVEYGREDEKYPGENIPDIASLKVDIYFDGEYIQSFNEITDYKMPVDELIGFESLSDSRDTAFLFREDSPMRGVGGGIYYLWDSEQKSCIPEAHYYEYSSVSADDAQASSDSDDMKMESFILDTTDEETIKAARDEYLMNYGMTTDHLVCRYNYNRYNVYTLQRDRDEWQKYEECFELYFDEVREIGCVFRYDYTQGEFGGFCIDVVADKEIDEMENWVNWNPYSFLANMDRENNIILNLTIGRQELVYDNYGRLESYREYAAEPDNELLIQENELLMQVCFAYHDNGASYDHPGTISERNIYNPRPQSMRLVRGESYDENGRIIYANDLITSGPWAYYYIYGKDGSPKYEVCFDYDAMYTQAFCLLWKITGADGS